jgi:ABC-type sugar transport system ATPase subunit
MRLNYNKEEVRSDSKLKIANNNTPIVKMVGISKSFVGTQAVKNVDLEIFPGEVHGIVGENGAGKSTLMRVLAGFYPDYEGKIFIHGNIEKIFSPRHAMTLGIALVHQELSLVPELTVAANIFLGREPKTRIPGIMSNKRAELFAEQILSEIDTKIPPSTKIEQLTIAKQQIVEIAKGISMRSEVLILDEPTSSLTEPEIKDLFKVIRTLKERGVAIIYISHKLSEVFEIADQITVLRDGIKVNTKRVSQWDESSLVKDMVGRNLSDFFSRSHQYTHGEVILEVKNLTYMPYFKDITFKLYKGEVLGIYGLVGSGRTELAESIFGLSRIDSGYIYINNKTVQIKSPYDAITNEIALVPEDRRVLGIFPLLDVKKNLSLPHLRDLSLLGFLKRKEELNLAKKNVQDLKIRTPAISALISTLSGGNQQKVVLGKWLNTNPKILILDDPTRGIDVGAKAEIRGIIDLLAAEEKAIILISSELPEILGMSDRVLVMREGQIVGEYNRDNCNEEILGACAISKRI